MARQPASRTPSVALKWTLVTEMPAALALGAMRPARLATESTAWAAGASAYLRATTTASAITPHRALAGSRRHALARSVVARAIG